MAVFRVCPWLAMALLAACSTGGAPAAGLSEFNGATLAVAVSPTEIDVFWDEVAGSSDGFVFEVFVARAPRSHTFVEPFAVVPGGASSTRLGGLTPGLGYFIVVRVRDAADNLDGNMVEVHALTFAEPPQADGLDFDSEVLPIFVENCTRCHGGFTAGECNGIMGLCFESYEAFQASAFNGREVIPLDSAGSELVKRITGQSSPRMPFDGPPFLTGEEIAVVKAWIDAGALRGPPAEGNRAPRADAGGPYQGTPGVPVTLSGSGSLDPDGDALTFAWDFGDGTTGSAETPVHIYAVEGVYQVSLIVRDGQTESEPSSTSVTVVPEGFFVRDPTMESVCSQCHGVRIRLTDGRRGEITPPGEGLRFFPIGFFMECNLRSAQAWADTVARMRNQNACPMTDEEEVTIVDFLSANYAGGDPRAGTFSRVCSACHSPTIPTSVPRSPSQWQTTVDRMILRYGAKATPAERADIVAYLSDVAKGEPPEELPEAEGRIYMNLVCSTCHSPARVLEGETGLPRAEFRSLTAARQLTDRMAGHGCGLRGVTDVIVAKWLSTVRSATPDILSIDRYEYGAEDGELEIRAWSALGGSAVLTVTGDGGLDATMASRGDGRYRLRLEGVTVFPGRITITSSLGGSLRWHR